MKSSLFQSTLSMAFALCIVAVLAMIFLRITPDKELLSVITGVIAAYLTARNPNTATSATTSETDGGKTTAITTALELPAIISKKKK